MVRELEDRATREFVIPQRLALFYLGLGDTEKAIAWLQRAFEQRIPNFMALTREPAYDALRGDPRFIRLVSRIGVNP